MPLRLQQRRLTTAVNDSFAAVIGSPAEGMLGAKLEQFIPTGDVRMGAWRARLRMAPISVAAQHGSGCFFSTRRPIDIQRFEDVWPSRETCANNRRKFRPTSLNGFEDPGASKCLSNELLSATIRSVSPEVAMRYSKLKASLHFDFVAPFASTRSIVALTRQISDGSTQVAEIERGRIV